MWIKILKLAFVAAKSIGLDKKIKDWIKRRLQKVEEKVVEKANKKLQQIEDALGTVDPAEILRED